MRTSPKTRANYRESSRSRSLIYHEVYENDLTIRCLHHRLGRRYSGEIRKISSANTEETSGWVDEIYLPPRRVLETSRENRAIKAVIKDATERVDRFTVITAVDPVLDARRIRRRCVLVLLKIYESLFGAKAEFFLHLLIGKN